MHASIQTISLLSWRSGKYVFFTIRTAARLRQGVSRTQMGDAMRDQQDREGVKTCCRGWFCCDCADRMIRRLAGHIPHVISSSHAIRTRQGILIASERGSEKTTGSGNVPPGIADEEILAFIEALGDPHDI
jgi:hypothetical protein